MNYAVIGAGISGLSISGMLTKSGESVTVFEQAERPGGLVKCSEVEGNLFHLTGGHVFNSRRQDVLDWFWAHFERDKDFVSARRHAVISLPDGLVADYPIENHLAQLPGETCQKVIGELLDIVAKPPSAPASLGDFFKNRFGATLNELYFTPYNSKVWRGNVDEIALDWLQGKLPMPSVAEILLSNIRNISETGMVHSSFFYAKQGGSQFIADTLAQNLNIHYGEKISDMRFREGKWMLGGEAFDRVIYTGNVRELDPALLAEVAAGHCVPRLAELQFHGTTSVLCRIDPNEFSWVYMPSPRHRSHRIICTGNFAAHNNSCSRPSAIVEFSEQMTQEAIKEQLELIPFSPEYLAHHWEKYTYPIQNSASRSLIQELKTCLEPRGFYLLGRFAEWEYYNMDAAMGAALDLAARL